MHTREFVRSYFDAWNQGDARGVAGHLAKNGIYCDVPVNAQYSGDDLIADLAAFFLAENHRYQLLGDILTSDSSIAFQYRMSSPNSSEEDWFGAEFMIIEGNGATKITDYYDASLTMGSTAAFTAGSGAPKYAKSGLNDVQMKEYTNQLTALMDKHKMYLESDLTMLRLAAMVDCSVNHLSQAVNSGFGMSFFDFLNSYRIEDAKDILSQTDSTSTAVLDVSFAVGFNSNSAFYAAFKKATGQTPAQYRRTHSTRPVTSSANQ
jgi:AraC-like DNA-binding protein